MPNNSAPPLRRRLYVLLITPMFPPITVGGGGMHVFYLALALGRRRGVRVHVFAPGEQLPGGDAHWFFRSPRTSVHRTDFTSGPGNVPCHLAIERCLSVYARVKAEPGYDAYGCSVIHGQHFAGVFVGLHLQSRFGDPLIATLHKTPIGRGAGNTVLDRDATYAHLDWLVKGPTNAFIAGSDFFSTELTRLGAGTRTTPILHGVPSEWLRARANRLSPRKAKREVLKIDEGDKFVVCPVRQDDRKLTAELIEAAKILKTEMRDTRLRFLITAADREELIKSVREAGVEDDFLLLQEPIPIEYFYSVLKAGAVCVVPTTREGLGLSVLEALAVETPVVATDAEGIREIITNEESGCLYAQGQPRHLAYYVERLIRDKEFRKRLIENGSRVVAERFSDTAMAERTEELYRSLLPS